MEMIYKYPVPVADEVEIEMPEGASVLTVQMQKGICCMWCKVNPDAPFTVKRKFEVIGTGQEIKTLSAGLERSYVGTFQLYDGALVFHVFEIEKDAV